MIGGNFSKPGMGGGVPAPLPQGGVQNQQLQQRAQANVPFQGQFNGNPRGANNMPRNNNPFGFQGQGQAPAWSQQTNLGRYRPPTMSEFGGNAGGFNSNQWNDFGGMDYNLPGSYGSPLGQGQFAPMPQQFLMGQMGSGGVGGGNPYYRQAIEAYFSNPRQFQGGGGMPPGKDGTPLRDPHDPRNNPMYHLFHNTSPVTPPAAAAVRPPTDFVPMWDRPETMNYNMSALRQMMGGY